MDLGLKGKFALVTGGSHGIGLANAHALAAEGCNVAICSRSLERLRPASDDLQKHGVRTLALQADALDPASLDLAMSIISHEWGGVDILVNNVGGGGRWGSSVEETGMEVWQQVYDKNATAAIQFTRWALPKMREKKWGRVVTITSINGGKDGTGRPWFAMAKAAETAFMKAMATSREYVRDGVTFNSVAPGEVDISDADVPASADRLPLGRLGKPEEVAAMVAFLCSEQASLVNGSNIAVDGGQSRAL